LRLPAHATPEEPGTARIAADRSGSIRSQHLSNLTGAIRYILQFATGRFVHSAKRAASIGQPGAADREPARKSDTANFTDGAGFSNLSNLTGHLASDKGLSFIT
jgi:hypothetical protein